MGNIQAKHGAAPQGGAVEPPAEPPQDQVAALDPRSSRRRRTFRIPSSARVSRNDPQTITLVELKVGEIEAAYEAGRGQRVKISAELSKLSIFKIDGKVVGVDDVEARWPGWSQKVRQLAVVGYDDMHNTSDTEDAAFLESGADDE